MTMPSADEWKVWGKERLSSPEGSLMSWGLESQRMRSEDVLLSWRTEGDLLMEDILRLWERFTGEMRLEDFQSDVAVFPAWQRSRAADTSGTLVPVRLRRAPDMNVRIRENQLLIQSARPLLKRFSNALGESKHVVCLTDIDGVLLESIGNDTILKVYGLLPGYDWSEEVMGTNGAGTALAIGKPVAVLGPDHYQLPFRDSACLGTAIRKGKEVVGALDLRIHVSDVQPTLLKDVILLAEEIGKALDLRPE
jgi:sigma-54 dependent transcriptional regulator, acetoin dehydrogenase operon transcriptional activator AcoR